MKKYFLITLTLLSLAFLMSCSNTKYPSTSSKQALTFYKQGEDYYNQLYFRNALKKYLCAFEIDSGFAMAAMKTAIMYLQFGETDSGAYYFRKAFDLSNSKSNLERLIIHYHWAEYKRNEIQISLLADSLIALAPSNFEVRLIDAQEKWRRFQFEEARKAYQKIVKDYPNYILAYNNIGYLYAREGFFKEAVSNLEKYKRYAGNQLNPFDSLAEIYIAIGRYYEAIRTLQYLIDERYDEILQNEYIGVSVYVRLAAAHRKLGQYQKALAYLDQANQLFTSHFSRNRIYLQKFQIYRELEETVRMEQALDTLKSNLPDNDFPYQTATLYIMENKFDKVLDILNQPYLKKEQDEKAKRNILVVNAAIEGELNLKTGLYKEASEKYKLAADTYNDIINANELRLKQYISLGYDGDYSTALNFLRQSIKDNPNCPLALIYTAEFYLKSGKKTEAQAYIAHFLNLWKDAVPDSPYLRHAKSISDQLNL